MRVKVTVPLTTVPEAGQVGSVAAVVPALAVYKCAVGVVGEMRVPAVKTVLGAQTK